MVNCMIKNCANRSYQKNFFQKLKEKENKKPYTFHKFPKDLNLRFQWLVSTKFIEKNLKKYSSVCSEHFADSSFILSYKKDGKPYTKLSLDAIPHITETDANIISKEETCEEEDVDSKFTIKLVDEKNEPEILQNLQPATSISVTRTTSISPERQREWDISPGKKIIDKKEEKICQLKKKIKTLQRSNLRHVKKIASLNDIIKDR